jgi:transposase-like protein
MSPKKRAPRSRCGSPPPRGSPLLPRPTRCPSCRSTKILPRLEWDGRGGPKTVYRCIRCQLTLERLLLSVLGEDGADVVFIELYGGEVM